MKIYEWTEMVSSLPDTYYKERPDDRDVKKITNSDAIPMHLSVLADFFVFPAIMTENMITSIPLFDKSMYEKCMRDIAPFFSDVLGYFGYNEEMPHMIQFSRPLEGARELYKTKFRNNELHPIVQDLYGSQENRPNGKINKNVQLKVAQGIINNNYVKEDFDEVFDFLKSTFFKHRNRFPIIPTNWFYTDALKDSVAINYFNSRSKGVYLIVDDPSGRVIGMDIYL
ncbi:hypothetical protein [Paenibacillus sp. IHBB 3054]|uniref:hypothetical protein n=1 Tax=Paenibacillus sp. IHBB 3054 TaxID=3425689 RepID=UPI003F66164E